jgi:hypothetical protein
VCGCVDNFSPVEGVATPKPSMTRKHLDTRSGGYRRQVDRGVLTILLCYCMLEFPFAKGVEEYFSVLGRPETEISDS